MADRQFLAERVTKTKELIVLYEDKLDQIVAGTIQSYTLDTGQNRQVVTKANIATLQNYIDVLYNRLATLEARLGQCGHTYVFPCY
jgi:hypothetical protein